MNPATNQPQAARPRGCSCVSCLFSLFMSGNFLLWGIFFALMFIFLQSPAGYPMLAGGIFLVCFFWQRRASSKGCFTPVFILALFLVVEFSLLGVMMYETDGLKKINFQKLQQILDEHAPGLYDAGQQAVMVLQKGAKQTFQAGLESVENAFNILTQSDEEKEQLMLEEAFSNNPGDPAVVLALADAFMKRNDLASTRLAIALYEALVETDPCDAFLARLADAYGKIFRYDLAFATAVRRFWLPHAMMGRAARQVAFFAVTSGDLPRGIFELEKALQQDPLESEEMMLLLAGLYSDIGNKQQARALLDQVIASTPAGLSVAVEATRMKQATGN